MATFAGRSILKVIGGILTAMVLLVVMEPCPI